MDFQAKNLRLVHTHAPSAHTRAQYQGGKDAEGNYGPLLHMATILNHAVEKTTMTTFSH
jgi:hypothetical protein